MPYCAFNNGLSLKSVISDYIAQNGEVIFSSIPTPEQLASSFAGYTSSANDESLKSQIRVLENQQTPRRIREAIAGTDNGWLAGVNTQIAALRAQLS